MAIIVEQEAADQAQNTDASVATTSNVTSGNDLIVGVQILNTVDPGTLDATDIALSGTATFGTAEVVTAATVYEGSNYYLGAVIVRYPITGSGTCTATAQAEGGGNWKESVHVIEVSDLDSGAAEDSNSATSSTGVQNFGSGNATSAGAALFVGLSAAGDTGSPDFTAGTDWTGQNEERVDGPGTYDPSGFYQTRIVTTGTTDESLPTLAAAPGSNVALVAVFAEASSGRTVNCSAASITASEQASTINSTRDVDGTLATIGVTPPVATVDRQRGIAATVASITATPQVATVILGGARVVNAALATISLTANAVTGIAAQFMDGVMTEEEWWSRRRRLFRRNRARRARR